MTLQALPVRVILGPQVPLVSGSTATSTGIGSQNTITFDAAGDAVAVVFQATATTMIDRIAFRCSVSVAGTAGDVEATIQTLDTSGLPSGTIVTNSGTGASTISASGAYEISGVAGTASLSVGTQYALVLTAGAGWDRTMTINTFVGTSGAVSMPYLCSKTGASWSKTAGANTSGFLFGVADSSGNYMSISGAIGAASVATQSFSNSTNPDERGNVFTLTAPATCVGLSIAYSAGSAPADADAFSVYLYSDPTGTPTQLATQAIDGDAQANAFVHFVFFATAVDLAANTQYGITFKADSTDSAQVVRFDYNTSGELGGHCGTSFYAATRNNQSGALSTTNTQVYGVWPIFSKFDDATGGGGGGGMRLAGHGGLAA